jgi:hypothetical protein
MILKEFPSRRSTKIAPTQPTIVSIIEMISAGGESSCRGKKKVIPLNKKVPANADRRGSRPPAFAVGRLRRIVVAAISNMNTIVESHIARCIAKDKLGGVALIC